MDWSSRRSRASSRATATPWPESENCLSAIVTAFPDPDPENVWLEVARQTDQAERARRIAALIAEALPQVAPFERVVRQAAGADDEIAGLARDILGWQQTTTSRLVDVLAGAEGLRPGLNHDEAADLLFALGGPEVYHLRVEVRGWSPDRFESHLVGLLDQMTGKPRRQPRARRDESRR